MKSVFRTAYKSVVMDFPRALLYEQCVCCRKFFSNKSSSFDMMCIKCGLNQIIQKEKKQKSNNADRRVCCRTPPPNK